jgi:hypothetical protein
MIPAETEFGRLVYEPSEKHKKPWQRGRRGSLCPSSISLEDAVQLLEGSLLHGSKRYATDGDRAYCAQEHLATRWHGYPVGWEEVPPAIRFELVERHQVPRRSQKRYWSGEPRS